MKKCDVYITSVSVGGNTVTLQTSTVKAAEVLYRAVEAVLHELEAEVEAGTREEVPE